VVRILSIDALSNRQSTAEHGQYNVVIEVDGTPYYLEYTCDIRDDDEFKVQSVTWKPEDSVLANRKAVDVSVVTTITDTVVQYHRTKSVQLRRVIEANL
jgi:hypothetical protein